MKRYGFLSTAIFLLIATVAQAGPIGLSTARVSPLASMTVAGRVKGNGNYQTPYILAQSAVPVSIIQCNTGITWTLAANPGNGKTRITSSGAHGLTTSPAVGKSIYITGWTGTGVAGFYNVATVVDATNLDIDLTYAAGLGNPTVVQANTEVTLATVTLPGGVMGPNGAFRMSCLWGTTSSANAKALAFKFGGVGVVLGNSVTNVVGVGYTGTVRNRNSQSVQVGSPFSGDASFSSSSGSPLTLTKDTSVSQPLTFTGKPAVANEAIQLDGYTIEILPGA